MVPGTNVTFNTRVPSPAMLTKRLDPSTDAQCCEHRILDDFDVALLI
jgi:hypothetical protein